MRVAVCWVVALLTGAASMAGCRAPGAPVTPSHESTSIKVNVRQWRVERSSSSPAPVRFAFPPPFENHTGVFPSLDGRLYCAEGGSLAGAHGWFTVNILDVTTGEDDLDQNVRHNVEMLQGKTFPTSTFTVRSISSSRSTLESGETVSVTLEGPLELKGVVVDLIVPASITLQLDSAGGRRLRLAGRFFLEQLRERFRIAGPGTNDGPSGNRVTVEFDVVLVPVEPSR